jgi:OOP family OmpA-OmpF porin
LDAEDPANRRIEFSLIAPISLEPTVVDTPGSGQEAMSATRAVMPLWLEMAVVFGLTYGAGVSIILGMQRRRAREIVA